MRVIDLEDVRYIVDKEGVAGKADPITPNDGDKVQVLAANYLGDGSMLELIVYDRNSWLHKRFTHLLYTAAEVA